MPGEFARALDEASRAMLDHLARRCDAVATEAWVLTHPGYRDRLRFKNDPPDMAISTRWEANELVMAVDLKATVWCEIP